MCIDRLDNLAETLKSSSGGTLSLEVIRLTATIKIPSAINRLYQTRSGVKIQIFLHNRLNIFEAIQLQKLQLGVYSQQPPHNGSKMLYQTSLT